MARKKRAEVGGSLDSLLDTMTNVVGILVIVLIITQLNVAEALKRIQSNLPEVTEEEVEQMRAMLDDSRDSMQKLETTWTELEPKEESEKKELEQIRLEIDETTANNEELVKENSDLEELRKMIADLKEKVQAEKTEVNTRDEALQQLKARLDETPLREVQPPKIVNLPNPRPAPENAEPRYVLCQNNKAYVVGDVYEHLFKVRDFIDQNFDKFVYRGEGMGSFTYSLQSTRKNPDTSGFLPVQNRDDQTFQLFRYDARAIQDYFEKNQVGGKDLVYKLTRAESSEKKPLDYLALALSPRPEGGETVEQFKAPNSALDQALKKAGINRNYVLFMVAPDSFDAYLEARQLAEVQRVPAGWTPWSTPEFSPATTVPREETTITLDDLPVESMRQLAAALTPVVDRNIETADEKLAAVTDPEAKADVETWARRFVSYASAVKSAPDIAATMRGRHDVRISPSAPNVPLIRIFEVEEIKPGAGKAPPPQKGAEETKKEKPAPKRDTLD